MNYAVYSILLAFLAIFLCFQEHIPQIYSGLSYTFILVEPIQSKNCTVTEAQIAQIYTGYSSCTWHCCKPQVLPSTLTQFPAELVIRHAQLTTYFIGAWLARHFVVSSQTWSACGDLGWLKQFLHYCFQITRSLKCLGIILWMSPQFSSCWIKPRLWHGALW